MNPFTALSRMTITPHPDDSFYVPKDEVPLVILFCDKNDERTTLVSRLSGYLPSQGYTIRPDTKYHPDNRHVWQQYALLEVQDLESRPVCRIMEFPGMYLFDSRLYSYKTFYSLMDTPVRIFLNHIYQLSCKRIWLLMPDMHELRANDHYAYEFYIHWLIDYIYPDPIMCACREADIPVAQEIDRYTFHIPIHAIDAADIRPVWESILHALSVSSADEI